MAIAALGLGACEGGGVQRPAGSEPVVTSRPVASRDGVIATQLPVDVVAFVFADAVSGTTVDGGLRLYLRHLPPDGLLRAAGSVREDLVARGWEITAERHYESAVELRSAKGHKAQQVSRATWVISRGGRVVLCEGIAQALHLGRLEEPLRQRCQRLEVAPIEPPE